MRSVTDEINHQQTTGRRTVDQSIGEIQMQFKGADLSRVRVLAAGVLIVALATGAGVVVHRRRRRRTLARRCRRLCPNRSASRRPFARS